MILYLDTSSLIKLYCEEDGSSEVRDLVSRALVVATSVVAYPEARSALARLHREGALTGDEHRRLKQDLEQDWDFFLTLQVTERIWRRGGQLAEDHGLRGFDSIHLASYLTLTDLDLSHRVRFSSFDDRLDRAAAKASAR